MINKKELSTIL